MIKLLEDRGYTYSTSVGLTYDTSRFSDYDKFANLDLQNQEAGYRVQVDDERRAPWDFALWITNKPNHIMRWNSPWGEGYPGWHIECSAMSKKYLGEQIDIHTGGVDHIKIHHTNEIAQSEGASGKKFVNYWIHTDFLQVNKEKMSKSIGNLYTLENLKENGYSPLSLRYLFMKGDYKKPFDFTWESLFNAQNELVKLWKFFASQNHVLHGKVLKEFKTKFIEGLNDSFNTSKAISVLWELVNSMNKPEDKAATAYLFDTVLGLDLENAEYELQVLEDLQSIDYQQKQNAQLSLLKREEARRVKDYAAADSIRKEIEKIGYLIVDTPAGSFLEIKVYGKLGDDLRITSYGEQE
jgi:cysteinyl-tRNA synthetase